MSALEELKAIDKQAADLTQRRAMVLETAKKEAREKVEAAIADLNALGFNYKVVEGSSAEKASPKTVRRTASDTKRPLKNAPCKICGFKTDPLHDGRMHRNHEAAFTTKELADKGWKKVG